MPAWLCSYIFEKIIQLSFCFARYTLRVNDDNWLLQTVTSLNFARSQSMFLYASPKVWNSLPLSLREIETLCLFKQRLKAYYLNLTFEDITTLCNAGA